MIREIGERDAPSRALAAVRRRLAPGEAARAWGPALDEVWTFLRAHPEVEHTGTNVFVYHPPAAPGAPMDADFGVELAAPFAGEGAVRSVMTPAGRVVSALHVGDHRGLPTAHAAAHAYAAERGLTLRGASWEIYGHGTPDPAKSEVRVEYMIAPRVVLVVAAAANGVIGREGKMPWHLSEDLKRFKRLTMGHRIVMGRKTWESIGRALPGRENVVVTRQAGYRAEGARVVGSLDAALAGATGDVYVIGGGEVYAQALPRADVVELTEVHADFEGDARFPSLGPEWVETAREPHPEGAPPHAFVTLRRRPAREPGRAG